MTRAVWPRVMVTGHRSEHLDPVARAWVPGELRRLAAGLRADRGTTTGVSGMAIGADLWWADAVVDAGLRLEAHVPFPQQPDGWTPADRAEWERLLGHAAHVVTYGTGFHVRHLLARNWGMVQRSDQVVAVWVRGRPGGTRSAIEYAVRRGLRPLWVDPVARVTTWPSVDSWWRMLAQKARPRRAA
ncbi:hypothetical protein [Paractinoplanes rishiriensis]|uniref:Uncharacterized protein n=1 Tax=Paractinoplanes rishiriensis TaxID=1050105 RepID=A0A919MRL7_9ACTN|nr:hypothetical protein [Actinoplanes rishiriensis]GIE97341.1 hypothetical protein Ari01nite_48060 [Actinoplanes rishiriensis]